MCNFSRYVNLEDFPTICSRDEIIKSISTKTEDYSGYAVIKLHKLESLDSKVNNLDPEIQHFINFFT